MATLIAVYNSEGCVGRCDAKCYQAHEPACNCICRGKNHGAGVQQATRNTEELAEQWIEEYKRRSGTDDLTFERPGVQMELAFE
jgi:hypothetical protein